MVASERARNVLQVRSLRCLAMPSEELTRPCAPLALQHGVEWMRDEKFGESLPARLHPSACERGRPDFASAHSCPNSPQCGSIYWKWSAGTRSSRWDTVWRGNGCA